MFELIDASGNPAGRIEVMLRWRSAYLPPSSSISTNGEAPGRQSEGADPAKEELPSWQDEGPDGSQEEEWAKGDPVNASTPQPEEAAPQAIPDNSSSSLRSSSEASGAPASLGAQALMVTCLILSGT